MSDYTRDANYLKRHHCRCNRVRTPDGLAALAWVKDCPLHHTPQPGMSIIANDALEAWLATSEAT